MHENYKWVIDRIISKYEGDYSNDPGDAGGPTRYGITYIDAAEYLHLPQSQTYGMMRNFSLANAETIYSTKYAVKCRFDELPSGIDMLVLDYDINSGVARGPRVLQAIFGLPQSGIMTDATITATKKANYIQLIDQVCDERLHFMHQIKGGASWERFGRGWQARVDDLRITCKHLATAPTKDGVPDMPNQKTPEHMGKATHINPKDRKTVIKTAGGGAAGGGASHLVTHDALVTGLIVGGIIIVGGFAYYELVRSQKVAQTTVVIPPLQPLITRAGGAVS